VASDNLRGALFVIYLTSAHLRSIGIDIPVRVISYHREKRKNTMLNVGCCGLEHHQGQGESSSATAARPAGDLRADYGFVATMDREIMRDPEREVGYGITDSWYEIVETLQGAPVSTDTELGGYMREFEMRVRQDTEEVYMRLDDEQNASDLVRGEVMSLRTTVLGQMTEIRELHVADRRRQTVISEMLKADHRRSVEIIELRTALQGQGLAGGPTQPELPEEAGSGS
nr:hypothetical protein [Tanacetum cinerariifolium]